jgi:hypothetical protein
MSWELYIEGRGFCGLLFGAKYRAIRSAKRVAMFRHWTLRNLRDGREVKGK